MSKRAQAPAVVQAFMAGMDRLGFGDIASPHACHNLANYLASETEVHSTPKSS